MGVRLFPPDALERYLSLSVRIRHLIEENGMTSQPPPPGDQPPAPPPPPPGQWGPPPGGPAGSGGSFDPKTVNPLDWAILGIGFLIFIFSFIDFYSGATITCGGRSADVSGGSESAWHDI